MSDNIISIVKNSDGTMTVKSWGSVDIKDKAGQRIPISTLSKDAPYMMMNKPKTHWGHTDIEVGFIKDLQIADKMTKKEGLKKGVIVTSDVPGNRRYLNEIQKKLRTGIYQMSIRGFAYAKDKDGDSELLKDIEGVNYAWVPKGCNYEADTIEIDGTQIKKEDNELEQSPSFMKEVQKYMEEGMSYRKAFALVKDLFSTMILKKEDDEEEVIKYIEHDGDGYTVYSEKGEVLGKHDSHEDALSQLRAIEVNKGDEPMADDIEAIKKELEETKKAIEEVNQNLAKVQEENTSLVKEKEAIAKERDGFKSELETVKKTQESVPESLTKEQITEMIKADRTEVKKELMEELTKDDGAEIIKALGYKPVNGATLPTDILKQDSDKPDEFAKNLAKQVLKGEELLKNEDIDSVSSYEDMEKSLIGGE